MTFQYDIADLPSPAVLYVLAFEEELKRIETRFIALHPDYEGLIVESDPIKKVFEAWAYDNMVRKAEINEKLRQTMLTFATGANLDQIAANTATVRLINENDESLRYRAQHAPEKWSIAGPTGAYEQLTLEVDGNIKQARAQRHTPEAGSVTVNIITYDNNGIASRELCDRVRSHLIHDNVAPLCDTVFVEPTKMLDYELSILVTYYSGADQTQINNEITEALQNLSSSVFKIGEELTHNAIHDAARIKGVQNIRILSPATDIRPAKNEAIRIQDVVIKNGGEYERR